MSSQFGYKERIRFRIGPLDATSVAVNQDHFIIPSDAGCAYEVESVYYTLGTPSSSGTLKLRVITDTSAAGDAASSTVVELLSSAIPTNSGTGTTATVAPKVASIRLLPGNRISSLSGGTQTSLVGLCIVVTLRPVVESGS